VAQRIIELKKRLDITIDKLVTTKANGLPPLLQGKAQLHPQQ
jgi:hypothetical protein